MGWVSVNDQLPGLNQCVVATNGKERWLDMRISIAGVELGLGLGAGGHARVATHWHPIDDLPAHPLPHQGE